jgi:hypothetical protein
MLVAQNFLEGHQTACNTLLGQLEPFQGNQLLSENNNFKATFLYILRVTLISFVYYWQGILKRDVSLYH